MAKPKPDYQRTTLNIMIDAEVHKKMKNTAKEERITIARLVENNFKEFKLRDNLDTQIQLDIMKGRIRKIEENIDKKSNKKTKKSN